MACAPVWQAVATAEFGPFAPSRTETCPAARLMIEEWIRTGHPIGAALEQGAMLAFNHLEPTDSMR